MFLIIVTTKTKWRLSQRTFRTMSPRKVRRSDRIHWPNESGHEFAHAFSRCAERSKWTGRISGRKSCTQTITREDF